MLIEVDGVVRMRLMNLLKYDEAYHLEVHSQCIYGVINQGKYYTPCAHLLC